MAGNDDDLCFTRPTAAMISKSLGTKMIRQVDLARNIVTRLGFRAYSVKIIHTGWSGPRRGEGQEYVVREMEILPVPMIGSLNGLNESMTPVGLDEVGSLQLSEVSGRYSEAEVMGLLIRGMPLDVIGEQCFYEITLLSAGIPVKRRFSVNNVPSYNPTGFEWTVSLTRARSDRDGLTGDPT